MMSQIVIYEKEKMN